MIVRPEVPVPIPFPGSGPVRDPHRPPPRPVPVYIVTGCPPATAVASRTHGVLASTRLLFCTSQEP
ncbi:hypothetical protein GCM10018792_17920 [Streptomyces rubradiris]|nr:hypothetical protein GCM10018792_17920 [Streptomyces rubradiris]